MEQWVPPPSWEVMDKEHQASSVSCGRNKERSRGSDRSPVQSSRKKKKVLGEECSGLGDGLWEGQSATEESEEEITPSSNMRKILTRLQERWLLTPKGGSSAINGPRVN